jgi:hypothetical protein
VLGFGQARAKKGFMAQATVPAARNALNAASVSLSDIKAIKTHNPFAVNDIYLAREMGIPVEGFNNYGCSLIFGHPQGPTGMRQVIELIEELALLGGGFGLFTGCAAGDTGAAIVPRVDVHSGSRLAEIILLCVSWHLRYSPSYRDPQEIMLERGLHVDHRTIYRWVQHYAPELDRRCRPHFKTTMDSWRVDETYIQVKKVWMYLYRAVDRCS